MQSTRGVVLNHIKYKETSIIVNIYTEAFGQKGYIVNNVRSKKNRGLTVLLQPLTLLDMQVNHRPNVELHRIKDFKSNHPLTSIPFDQSKRAMAFFLTEVMNKVLREEEPNLDLFQFIQHSIEVLDTELEGSHNFHLFFLFQLTKFLGFSAENNTHNYLCFDLLDGRYTNQVPLHGHFIEKDALKLWEQLGTMRIEQLSSLKMSAVNRNNLLDTLLTYYKLHMEGMGEIKSLAIIRQLFQ